MRSSSLMSRHTSAGFNGAAAKSSGKSTYTVDWGDGSAELQWGRR